MNNEEAIKNITAYVYLEWENMPSDVIKALDIMRECTEKQIPKKVLIPKWDSAKCPTCGKELSESLGDGYYRHPTFLVRCPDEDCGQKLDWGEEE